MSTAPLRKVILIVLLGAVVLLLALVVSSRILDIDVTNTETLPENASSTISIAGTSYAVIIADTPASQSRGLGLRDDLPSGIDGMLFVFDELGQHGFWMKDMRFSIHMYWLNAEGVVVHAEHTVTPETFPQVYESSLPAQYVLEIPVSRTKVPILNPGDLVELPFAARLLDQET